MGERQFVGQADQHLISDDQRARVERLILERISLRGSCRAVGVGLKWLLGFLAECYAKAPEDLNVHLPTLPDGVVLWVEAYKCTESFTAAFAASLHLWFCEEDVPLTFFERIIMRKVNPFPHFMHAKETAVFLAHKR